MFDPLNADHRVSGLMWAVYRGDLKIVMKLLGEDGVDVNCTDFDKRTPLHHACSENQMVVARYLMKMGANINALDAFGLTPLDSAITRKHLELTEWVRLGRI